MEDPARPYEESARRHPRQARRPQGREGQGGEAIGEKAGGDCPTRRAGSLAQSSTGSPLRNLAAS